MVFGRRSAAPFSHAGREEDLVRGISVFRTRQGQAEALVEACGGVANILNDAEGSRGASLHRGVEGLDSFTLIVEWDSGQPEVRHAEAVA